VTPEASRPALLPTPPASPMTFKKPIKTASAIPPASTTESQDIAHLHAFLQDCQSQIDSLTLKLKDTQNELQGLRNQRQEHSTSTYARSAGTWKRRSRSIRGGRRNWWGGWRRRSRPSSDLTEKLTREGNGRGN